MSIHIVCVIGLVFVFIVGLACGNHRDNAVIARRAGVKTLVLTHVLEHIDRPGIREQIINEVKQEFDGQVIWGEDLMQLEVAG